MVDPKELVPVPPGSWRAVSFSCVSYLSSEIGCHPSSSFVQPCARGRRSSRSGRILAGWHSSVALRSRAAIYLQLLTFWNWQHPRFDGDPSISSWVPDSLTVRCAVAVYSYTLKWQSVSEWVLIYEGTAPFSSRRGPSRAPNRKQGWDTAHFITDLQTAQVAPGRISARC